MDLNEAIDNFSKQFPETWTCSRCNKPSKPYIGVEESINTVNGKITNPVRVQNYILVICNNCSFVDFYSLEHYISKQEK